MDKLDEMLADYVENALPDGGTLARVKSGIDEARRDISGPYINNKAYEFTTRMFERAFSAFDISNKSYKRVMTVI